MRNYASLIFLLFLIHFFLSGYWKLGLEISLLKLDVKWKKEEEISIVYNGKEKNIAQRLSKYLLITPCYLIAGL